jgi:hypothetical protein
MATSDQPRPVDFGFDSRLSAYHFVLVVERDGAGVHVEERFALSAGDAPEDAAQPRRPVLKASLDAYRWSRIAETARSDFNPRVVLQGGRAARWRPDETLLAPHLGKELVLLFWVVEDADATLIPNMVANWTGLAPEERWWLYTTINATAGHPEHGRERGWRRAVKIALAENPSAVATPGGWLSRGEIDRPEPPKRASRKPTREAHPKADQLSLLSDASPAQMTLEGDAAPAKGHGRD